MVPVSALSPFALISKLIIRYNDFLLFNISFVVVSGGSYEAGNSNY